MPSVMAGSRARSAVMPAVVAVMAAVMLVDDCSGCGTESGSYGCAYEGMPVEGGGDACSRHSSYGGSGKDGMIARAAGGKREGAEGYQAEREEAAHGEPPFGGTFALAEHRFRFPLVCGEVRAVQRDLRFFQLEKDSWRVLLITDITVANQYVTLRSVTLCFLSGRICKVCCKRHGLYKKMSY